LSKVLVIGSINMDLVVETERYPEAGETIIGGKFEQNHGGKGANYELDPEKIEKLKDKIIEAENILLQLEIKMAAVEKIVEIASENNTKIILDPAPARELPAQILAKVDYLLQNEGELNLLFPQSQSKSRLEKIEDLLKRGVKNIIVTKGEKVL